ncbi:hypothetical protein [Sphingobium quisquiliarum]|nr:hypothetical protein [Sphingobium quisquiliarum]
MVNKMLFRDGTALGVMMKMAAGGFTAPHRVGGGARAGYSYGAS